MEDVTSFNVEYEKISVFNEESKSIFELHFKELAKNYHNYLANYFVIEGGMLKNEFRFINARRFIEP